MLKKWAALDPVSQKEIDRNNAIYNHFQHNRNPLIDHPELIELIWGSDSLYNTFGNVGELDAQRPQVENLEFTENQIVITFTQDMDSSAAVEVSNYDCTKGVAFASARTLQNAPSSRFKAANFVISNAAKSFGVTKSISCCSAA